MASPAGPPRNDRLLLWLGLNRNTGAVAGAGLLMAWARSCGSASSRSIWEAAGPPCLPWGRKLRARSIGLYYLVRSLSIAPAALVGALLWRVQPALPFLLAGGVGLLGVIVSTFTVHESHHFAK